MSRKEISMDYKVYLEKWSYEGNRVRLDYKDGTALYMTKKDFDRAFGCIIRLTKAEADEEYAIHE